MMDVLLAASARDGGHLAAHVEVVERVHSLTKRREGRYADVFDEDGLRRGGPALHAVHDDHVGARVHGKLERGKREMDLADASLYWLAAETAVTEILTVDVADFSRYRLPRGKAFTLL